MWFDVETKQKIDEVQQIPSIPNSSYTIKNFERNSKFTVLLRALNSAGTSPPGYCEVDTSKIPVGRWPMIFSINAPIANTEHRSRRWGINFSPKAKMGLILKFLSS